MKIPRSGPVPAFLRQLKKAVDHHGRILERGLVVNGPGYKARQLKDGRISLDIAAVSQPSTLNPQPSPSGETCYTYGDYWPDYFTAPTVVWKNYCYRKQIFTWDSVAHTKLSPVQTFNSDGSLIPAFWFTPSDAAVHNLLRTIPMQSPDLLEGKGNIEITLILTMYRDVTNNPTPPPWHIPVGVEADSIPFVVTLCWRKL